MKNYLMKFSKNWLFCACLITSGTSCKKFIEVGNPPTSVTGSYVFLSSTYANAAVIGLYSRIMQNSAALSGGFGGINFCTALCADELKNYSTSTSQIEFFTNSLTEQNTTVSAKWAELYRIIYDSNAIIEGLLKSPSISDKLKSQLLGETKFIRAYCYFFLVNIFGEVPLLLKSDYHINSVASKTTPQKVYEQIILDLLDAKEKLDENYYSASNTVTTERLRPNKWSAVALLARIYLYTKNWENAELQSTSILELKQLYDTVSLNDVFLKNSKEAILQFQPVVAGVNTFDATCFVLTGAPSASTPNQSTAISDDLGSSFEKGDARKSMWIGSRTVGAVTYSFPFKFKENLSGRPLIEYNMVLRVSEQYLIRSEARIHQGKVLEGVQDINTLRRRARERSTIGVPNPLPDLPASLSKDEALLAVEAERRHELFTEGGHRWFDLIRTGRAGAVLEPLKGSSWQDTDRYWPIPQAELALNPNLKPQNPGYN